MQRILLTLSVGLLVAFSSCSLSESTSQDAGSATNSVPVTSNVNFQTTIASTSEIHIKPNTNLSLTGIRYRAPDEGTVAAFVTVKKAFEFIKIPTKSDNGGKYDNSPYEKRELSIPIYAQDKMKFFGTCIQEYESSSKDSAETKAEVSEYVKHVLEGEHLRSRKFTWEELSQQGNILVGGDLTQCDPLLLAYAGYSASRAHRYSRAQELLFVAIRKFADSEYTCRHVIRAHRWLAQIVLRYTRDDDLRYTVRKNYIDAMEYWMTRDLRATASEYPLVLDEISMFYAVLHLKRILFRPLDESTQTPDITTNRILLGKVETADGFPRWLLHMIAGIYRKHVGDAWQTNAYNDDPLPQESLALMEESYQLAKAHFLRAYEINPDCPSPCLALIMLANIYGDETLADKWFRTAVAIQFDLESAYELKMVSLDRSIPEMIAFARECAATNRYDTFIPFYLVSIERRLESYGQRSPELSKEALVVLQKLADNADDQGTFTRAGYLTMLASDAIYFGDVETAFDAMKQLKGQIDQEGYSACRRLGDEGIVVGFIAAMKSERAAQAPIVSQVFQDGGFDLDQLVQIKEALSQVKVDEVSSREQVFWKSAGKILDLYRNISSGDWIDLPFTDPQQQIWRYHYTDYWTKLDDGSVQAAYGAAIDASIPFTAGRPFVYECDVEVVDDYGWDYSAGIAVGFTPEDQSYGRAFTIDPLENEVFINGWSGAAPFHTKWPMKPGKNRITVLALPGYYQMQVNGEVVHEESNDQFHIDVGGLDILTPTWVTGGGVVRFSNARIRGWNHGLPPAERNVATRLKYYKRITDQDPEYVNAWYEQGIIHIRTKEYEEAERCFQAALDAGANPVRVSLYRGEIYEAQGEWAKAVAAFEPIIISDEEVDSHADRLHRHAATRGRLETRVEFEYGSDYRWRYLMKLAWILYFAPDDAVRNTGHANHVCSGLRVFHREDYLWLYARMAAASYLEPDRAYAMQQMDLVRCQVLIFG